jgi:hypothetical protein
MKKYSYQGIDHFKVIVSQIMGMVGIVIFTAFACFLVYGIMIVQIYTSNPTLLEDPRVSLACFALICIVIAWILGLIFINYMPTIWVDDKGLEISVFLFFRVQIPWSDIIDVKIRQFPNGSALVSARKITFFHRIYGWLYARTVYPSFLIGQSINNRDNLIREIRQRIQRSV